MRIDYKISDGKLQYINKEAAKISALPAEKIDKYEYFTGEEILSCKQRKIIEQIKLACSAFGKAVEKQTEQQVSALKSLDLSNKK